MRNPKERFYLLDLMRFTAAVMVVFFHYLCRWPIVYCPTAKDGAGVLNGIAQYGYLGVDLFFIISGFVIIFSSQDKSSTQFAVSRFLRLYPAYWFGVSLTALILVLFPLKEKAISVGDYLINLTMLQGYFRRLSIDGVYWTLMVELQFYAFVFFIITIGKMHHLEKWLWGWFLVSAALFFGEARLFRVLGALTISSWSFYFIAGCVFYLMHADGCSAKRCLLVSGCWVFAVLSGIKRLRTVGDALGDEICLSAPVVAIIISLFFGAFFLLATKKIHLFESRVWLVIGGVTYPLYLIHQCIGYVLLNALGTRLPAWTASGAVFLLMLGVAYIINTRLESPMRRWLGPVIQNALAAVRPGRVKRSDLPG